MVKHPCTLVGVPPFQALHFQKVESVKTEQNDHVKAEQNDHLNGKTEQNDHQMWNEMSRTRFF